MSKRPWRDDHAVKGTFFVAETIPIREALREASAVDLDERTARSWAGKMNGLGDKFFSRAALTPDQNGRFTGAARRTKERTSSICRFRR